MSVDGLRHPVHEHGLIRRELSENCKTRCLLCTKHFHGPTYCCLDCDVFLDETCASIELPLQIQHPSHPEHPLVFDGADRTYRCHQCRYYRWALDAFMTLPPRDQPDEEEDESIQHFLHEHRLAPFPFTAESTSVCAACRCHMFGKVYGCSRCMFLLHESCAQLPRKMQHPFHRQHPLALVADLAIDFGECCDCRVCGYRSRLMYHCDHCRLDHCVRCVVSTTRHPEIELDDGAAAIERSFHRHPLKPSSMKTGSKIICRVCQLTVSGEVYCCFDCVFFVHRGCSGELPQEMKHHLHPEHPLVLRAAAPYFNCGSCLLGCSDLTFNCERCKFDLDPQCTLRTLFAVEEGTPAEIRHFSHPQHPLSLVYSNEDVNAVDCDACNEPATGLAYCCRTCEFLFMLHKSCAEAALELEHEFHPQHRCGLLSRAPAGYFHCGACHKKSEGSAFCCAECEFYLDLECASRKPTLKHGRHEHRLTYFPASNRLNALRCDSCSMGCNRDLYRCVPCNFNLHYDCLPLPLTVEHESHPYHPLVLYDEYNDGRSPDDQGCDYCEEIRNLNHGVYHCAECVYTAHIECIIPTVVQPEGWKANEDTELDELDKDISGLEAKIAVMERNLKAAKRNLEALSEKRGYAYANG